MAGHVHHRSVCGHNFNRLSRCQRKLHHPPRQAFADLLQQHSRCTAKQQELVAGFAIAPTLVNPMAQRGKPRSVSSPLYARNCHGVW